MNSSLWQKETIFKRAMQISSLTDFIQVYLIVNPNKILAYCEQLTYFHTIHKTNVMWFIFIQENLPLKFDSDNGLEKFWMASELTLNENC